MRSTQTVHIFNLDAAAKAVSTFTFSTESYGQSGIAVFRELAAAEGVCVSREEALRAQPTNEVPLCALSGVCCSDVLMIACVAQEVDSVLQRVQSVATSRVAVCWCEGRTVRALLAGVLRRTGDDADRLLLVGSDGWADRGDVVQDRETAASGSLTVKIRSPSLSYFDNYYTSLKPHDNPDNPWFKVRD